MRICHELVQNGQAYVAIVICHEYFRYLFPVEPYEKFINTDPYRHTLKKMDELMALGRMWRTQVKAYKPDYTRAKSPRGKETLESKTSQLYSGLWRQFDKKTIWNESVELVRKRLPAEIIDRAIRGKKVLDMGCGSGRYTLALARLGAREVVGVDLSSQSYAGAQELVNSKRLAVRFVESNFHRLPFKTGEFDFVFCNGTLHHSSSIDKGLSELFRVLKSPGESFLYLYADGGVFWHSRREMRKLFKNIPAEYTESVMRVISLPSHRFIFQDVWYVPQETHTSRVQLEKMLEKRGFRHTKLFSTNAFDLDRAIAAQVKDAVLMWGDGEHRYLLNK